MPRSSLLLPVLATLALLSACSIHPRIEMPGPAGEPVGPGIGVPGPRSAPPLVEGQGGPMIEQVCRLTRARSGWIAISYFIAGESCPPSAAPENSYNGAVIERHSGRPIGTILTVCADQAVPSGWQREYGRNPSGRCEGARVREGAPNIMVIRRVR